MVLRVVNEGEAQALSIALSKTAAENLILKLFSNNLTLTDTLTAANFTEVTGGGYAAVTLTPANWTITEGAPTSAAYPQVSFVFSAAVGAVYGYYVVGATSGKVRWAERFTDGPYTIATSGDQIKVTLNITLQDTLD